jgi:hypothetical protein
MADIIAVEITPKSMKYFIKGKKLPILIEYGSGINGENKPRWFCYKLTNNQSKKHSFYDGTKRDCIAYVKRLIKIM